MTNDVVKYFLIKESRERNFNVKLYQENFVKNFGSFFVILRFFGKKFVPTFFSPVHKKKVYNLICSHCIGCFRKKDRKKERMKENEKKIKIK